MAKVKFGLSLVGLGVWIWLLSRPLGPLPPLGKFLSPTEGFWQNCEGERIDFSADENLPGLKAEAQVWWDERRVPHIFAANAHDLFYLQGWVTARDRLFQMEIQTRAAAGRISEWIGAEAAVVNDRKMRRLGLPYAAGLAWETIQKDPLSREIVDAYTAGVNDYIHSLGYSSYPVEFKLLNVQPEDWSPLKTCLLLKIMAYDLTGRTDDLGFTGLVSALGRETFDMLFPAYPDSLDPIIPKTHQWEFDAKQVPAPEGYDPAKKIAAIPFAQPDENNGSNNWVVGPAKSANGHPMLANDPHLGLKLPSLWYEVQLSMPGMNVYGVSLPGSPLVVIGFNEKVAWGLTNAQRDVVDWYQIQFKDASRTEYKWGEGWEKTKFVFEKMLTKGRGEWIDTVAYTRHGPVTFDQSFTIGDAPINIACRWTAFERSNELLTFYKLAQSKNYADYREALTHYQCPGQNFVFACSDGDIAITQQGQFPLRWTDQGRFLLDGSNPAHEWAGWIPTEQNPTEKNPEQGYLSSANQHATDATYPYEIYGSYEHYRNRRINQVLSALSGATVDDMKKLQNDNLNLKAVENLDTLLSMVDEGKLDARKKEALADLRRWNRMNEADLTAPSVFELWAYFLRADIFDDEYNRIKGETPYPKDFTIAGLVQHHGDMVLIDNVNTPEKESLRDLVNISFGEAVDSLQRWSAGHNGSAWKWSDVRGTEINHLIRQLKPFCRRDIHSDGNATNVNSVKAEHGPSWRMVVEMGPEPVAWGVYPGGQSGNPGSPYYDNGVDVWARGDYFPLHLFTKGDEKNAAVKLVQTYKP